MDQVNGTSADKTTGEIRRLFETRGSAWYGGESISQLEHALQAAMFAERESASDELVVAALLHDVGHLLHDLPENVANDGVDDEHEMVAATWLKHRFPTAVVAPVALHVTAKRYLCATDSDYLAQLSPASVLSLSLQGGPMDNGEVSKFQQHTYYREALQLRKWDDAAKVVDLETPTLEHFVGRVNRVALDRQS